MDSAVHFYNETLKDTTSDLFLVKLKDIAKHESNKPEKWEIDYLRGVLSFEELLVKYIGKRNSTGALEQRGMIHEIVDGGFLSKLI